MTRPLPDFPADFLWGTATAAYQIEGAVAEDGRQPSVWDVFCADRDSGAIACDHYHRWPQDVALMAELGVVGYRFSIAWPRVQPHGQGPANPKGLAFYDRLVDALCEQRIVPVATLFHWDTPQAVEDEGGWLHRQTAQRFADYTAAVADVLADRVQHWITLNEPIVHLLLGYATGVHAPGRTLMIDALPAAHNLLFGHGLAVQALRARGARSVGITNSYSPAWPASSQPSDLAAAAAFDVLYNRMFTDPVLLGGYPAELASLFGSQLPDQHADDLAVIAAPVDFLGVNYYNPTRLRDPQEPGVLPFEMVPIDGYPTTSFGWPVVPDGLRELLTGLAQRYGQRLPPIYVTENGCSYDDQLLDGRVADQQRIDYLDSHLRAVHAAMTAGVDVRGYFVWSLMDNFEWAEGYTKRFGLVHVDYPTQTRTPKDSFHWYRAVIADSRRAVAGR